MKLVINGQSRDFPQESFTVTSLLAALELSGKPVVVELNREAVLASGYDTTPVADGSEVEIVLIAAGG